MSVTINASLTSGAIISSDTSGSLQLQTNSGTTALTIDTSQKVGIGTSTIYANVQIAGASNATVLKVSSTDQASGMLSLGDGGSSSNNVGVYRGQPHALSNGNWLNLGGYDGIAFTTGNNALGSQTEAMRIDTSGNLLVGGTDPSALGIGTQKVNCIGSSGASALLVTETSGSNASAAIILVASTSGYTANMMDMRTGMASGTGYNAISYKSDTNVTRFYVDGSGVIHSTSTSITAISDETLKTNIKPLETGLAEVLKLQARRFDWKDGSGTNVAGFISQEVEAVLPDLVAPWKQDENTTLLGLKMGDMIPTLVKAIQELSAELNALKLKVGG